MSKGAQGERGVPAPPPRSRLVDRRRRSRCSPGPGQRASRPRPPILGRQLREPRLHRCDVGHPASHRQASADMADSLAMDRLAWIAVAGMLLGACLAAWSTVILAGVLAAPV